MSLLKRFLAYYKPHKGLLILDLACAFFVADQPHLRAETVRAFLQGWEKSGKGLGCVRCGAESVHLYCLEAYDDMPMGEEDRSECERDGITVHLTPKEYAVLQALVSHPGRVVTQTQLLRELWGPTHVEDTHYLRIVIGKLRQKLGDDSDEPRYLQTEPGVGYRFIGDQSNQGD